MKKALSRVSYVAPLGGLALLPGAAFAAVPESVTTALANALTDSVTVAGAVIGIIVAVAAFRYMRRAIG
jgi:hypothetical protein